MAQNYSAIFTNSTENASNPHTSGSVDFSDIQSFQYYAWGVTGNIISMLGILGNILSLTVLCHRRLRNSTSVFLIALAIYDTVVLISLVLFMALPTIYFKTNAVASYIRIFPYLQPFAYPLALTAQTCSIYTTVGFTVERYIAVCHPLKAATYCTIGRAKKSVILILVCAVMYNIPRMLEYQTIEKIEVATNKTTVYYDFTDLGKNQTYRHIYFIYMHIFFMLLIPFAILTVMNIMLIRAVRKSSHALGKQACNQQQNDNNLTIMLISVVAVFLICQVPSIFDNIFMATLDKDTLDSSPFIKLTCMSSLMVIMNSAINFYLYCMFGEKFRRIFCQIFCSMCFKDHKFMRQETSIRMLTRNMSGTPTGTLRSQNCSTLERKYVHVEDHDTKRFPLRTSLCKQNSNGNHKSCAKYSPINDDSLVQL